jgi:hypothetical protein
MRISQFVVGSGRDDFTFSWWSRISIFSTVVNTFLVFTYEISTMEDFGYLTLTQINRRLDGITKQLLPCTATIVFCIGYT